MTIQLPLAALDATAGGRDGLFGGLRERVGLHGDGPAQFTTAEHLDQRGLADEALRVERTGIDIGEAAGLEGVEVQRLVLHAERVGEALELRHPHVQRHLPPG